MLQCDLNCDLGEEKGNDALIMPYISSANIACGFHAGNMHSMKETVALCIQNKVAIGAHPSYPDKENFGRIDLLNDKIKLQDLEQIISAQLSSLQKICNEQNALLHHVKLHGALYNRAAMDKDASAIICKTIQEFDSKLLVYGLSGSLMQKVSATYGLVFINEVFADRTYQDDGSLTARAELNALIENEDDAAKQVLQMVKENKVVAVSGKTVFIKADTICLHGDGKHAVNFVKRINELLNNERITIAAPEIKR